MSIRLGLLLSLVFAAPAWAQSGEDLVALGLVASVEQAAPGSEFLVGVTFEIAVGWHVYWRNAGESGLAPTVDLALPDGLECEGDWLWPAPARHDEAGLLTYVHEGRLTLLRRVRVGDVAPGTRLELSVTAEWLVCEEICLDGAGEAQLVVSVGAEARPASNLAAIEEAQRTLPRTPEEAGLTLESGWEGPALVLRVPGAAQLTWFPLTPEVPEPSDMLTRGQVAGDRIEVLYPRALPQVSGILAVERAGDTAYLAVALRAGD